MAIGNDKLKLVFITTVPKTLSYFRGQMSFAKARGVDVRVISSPGAELDNFCAGEGVDATSVAMTRNITPFQDIISLVRLWNQIKLFKPDIVQTNTPKGGLLGTMAACFARVPVRIYYITGLRYMTATGWKRKLLILTEKIACTLAHRVLCDSNSIRNVIIDAKLCPPHKVKVLCLGSVNGVDAAIHFNPDKLHLERKQIRDKYNIPEDAAVIGFVGRIVRDKGIVELAEAWKKISETHAKVYLMLVGTFETEDPLPSETRQILSNSNLVITENWCSDVAPFYAAMDLFVLPSYREGFGVVNIEAAALCLPVVATRIPGCVDSVQDGLTGSLVPARDSDALAEAIQNYLDKPELRAKHGAAGRERVLRDFRQEDLWEALYQEQMMLLRANGVLPEQNCRTSK